MKSINPVFIVGPSRSGTTLLYRILQKHSVFKPHHCAVGVDLTESQAFSAPDSIYNNDKAQRVGAYPYMLNDDDLFNEFLGEMRRARVWQKLISTSLLPGDYNFFTRRLLNYPRLRLMFWKLYRGPAMARAFFSIAKRARGVNRILEKTPAHLHRLPEIFCTYPNGKAVGIVRHPIDIFTSYKRRYEVERQTGLSADDLAWLRISPEQFCTSYAKDEEAIRYRQKLNKSRFVCIQYEHLIRHPEKTIREILQFLGEPFEEQCVKLQEPEHLHWKVDPHLFNEIKTKTKDWREFIEKAEAEYIESSLAMPMKRLGYQRYT